MYLVGIPKVYEFTQENNNNVMIMQLLGPSLESLLHSFPSKKMTIPTVCMVGVQIVKIMENLHSQNYIHRDIKPDNFVIGLGNETSKLYIIDFGLAKEYRNPITLKHNPYVITTRLIGTVRYASIHSLEGIEQSRRDDLESVAYLLIYLLKGTLPWQGLIVKRKEEKYLKVLEKKRSMTSNELCSGLPTQIERFLIYVKSLEYEEKPNYQLMIRLLEECLNDFRSKQGDDELDENRPFVFDWVKKSKKYLTRIKEAKSMNLQINIETITPMRNKQTKYVTPERVTRKEQKTIPEDNSITEKQVVINNYIKPDKSNLLKQSNITIQSKKDQTFVASVECTKTTQIVSHKKISSNGFFKNKTMNRQPFRSRNIASGEEV